MADQKRRAALVLVTMPAEADTANAGEIGQELGLAIAAGTSAVVVDFTQTSFCDCDAAWQLMAAHGQAGVADTALLLAIPAGGVLRLLELLGLAGALQIYPDLAAALAAAPQLAAAAPAACPALPPPMLPLGAEQDSRQARFAELRAQARTVRAHARELRGLMAQVRATRAKIVAENQAIRISLTRAQRTRELWLTPDNPQWLQHSLHARLQARLASMPVIEQAKGIIMAQSGWPEDQAFAALRQASQRENRKLRDVATDVVATTARKAPSGRPHPPGPQQPRPAEAGAKIRSLTAQRRKRHTAR